MTNRLTTTAELMPLRTPSRTIFDSYRYIGHTTEFREPTVVGMADSLYSSSTANQTSCPAIATLNEPVGLQSRPTRTMTDGRPCSCMVASRTMTGWASRRVVSMDERQRYLKPGYGPAPMRFCY